MSKSKLIISFCTRLILNGSNKKRKVEIVVWKK